MEIDDGDPTSDYEPSVQSENENDEIINEEDCFDIKIFNILTSMKYNKKTENKYLSEYGSEYLNILESNNKIKRKSKSKYVFKRQVKNTKEWKNLIKKVQSQVFMERLQ